VPATFPASSYDPYVTNTADVIVIGAGIIGCAVARELAQRSVKIRVFEARAVGGGATQASAGVLAPYIEAPQRGPLLDLAVRSLGMYERYVSDVQDESGVAVEYRRCGTLEIAVDFSAAERLSDSRAVAQLAAADAVWLEPPDVRSLEPSLPDSIQGALLIRAHAYVVASQLTEALTWAALRHGAEFETGRRVTAITGGTHTVEVITEDGEKWSTDDVVIATGSWTSHINVEPAVVSTVRPVRGQLLKLLWRGPLLRHVIWGPDCYVVPWSDGTVLVGATVEDVGFDERATAAGVRDLLDAACDLLPAIWGATFVEARAGLRPATADGLPVIGRSLAAPRIVYATGHYRNGVLLAPITASTIADIVLTSSSDPTLEALKPDRFVRRGQVP
jgi:glycine oxidase